MEIIQQFVVDGQTFNSIEEANQYVASQSDRRRVDAFVEHLKATGDAQRISKKQTDFILAFIQYEENVREGFELESQGKPVQDATVQDGTGKTNAACTSDAAPAEAAESGPDPKPATTAPEPEETTSEHVPDVGAPAQSKHVDGPDEELEEDPLAGLDL